MDGSTRYPKLPHAELVASRFHRQSYYNLSRAPSWGTWKGQGREAGAWRSDLVCVSFRSPWLTWFGWLVQGNQGKYWPVTVLLYDLPLICTLQYLPHHLQQGARYLHSYGCVWLGVIVYTPQPCDIPSRSCHVGYCAAWLQLSHALRLLSAYLVPDFVGIAMVQFGHREWNRRPFWQSLILDS